jgi:hypothetical protein
MRMGNMVYSKTFLAFLFLSCQSSKPMTTSTSGTLPHIEVTTDGGIAGRGLGGVDINRGTITASDLVRSCKGGLSEEEGKALASGVATFQPSKSAHGHPDQIGYTLKFGDVSVQGHGEEAPASVEPLFKTVWSIRQRVLAGCK